MTEKEISELYIRLAFYYESAIEALLSYLKGKNAGHRHPQQIVL